MMILALLLQVVPAPLPEMLPGDHAPLPLSLMLQPPRPAAPPADAPMVDVEPAPSAKAASAAVTRAVAQCREDGVRVGVAVVDAGGRLKAALSADGAGGGHVFVAARKAAAAAGFGEPTARVQAELRVNGGTSPQLKPYMAVSPGAVPLRAHGRLLGAIGVSGGSAAQDERCAIAGAHAATMENVR